MDSKHCATCGRPRGLSLQRASWDLKCPTVIVPRTGNPEDAPAQTTNDLIYNAAVWRNGGTSDRTHLCDDCLRIGLRAIKVRVDELLGALDEGHDRDAELVAVTQRLGLMQARYANLCHDHDRMQGRLKALMETPGNSEVLDDAAWEVSRGPTVWAFGNAGTPRVTSARTRGMR